MVSRGGSRAGERKKGRGKGVLAAFPTKHLSRVPRRPAGGKKKKEEKREKDRLPVRTGLISYSESFV